jgi:hypothetical protein
MVPVSIQVLGERGFSECGSLSPVTCASESRLSGIENHEFCQAGLIEIILSALVEVWVRNAFLGTIRFPLLHLNQRQVCHELKSGHSVKLV